MEIEVKITANIEEEINRAEFEERSMAKGTSQEEQNRQA